MVTVFLEDWNSIGKVYDQLQSHQLWSETVKHDNKWHGSPQSLLKMNPTIIQVVTLISSTLLLNDSNFHQDLEHEDACFIRFWSPPFFPSQKKPNNETTTQLLRFGVFVNFGAVKDGLLKVPSKSPTRGFGWTNEQVVIHLMGLHFFR